MYRGSSFLLEKDYRVHIPTINKILCPKYDVLLGADYNILLDEDNQSLLWEHLVVFRHMMSISSGE